MLRYFKELCCLSGVSGEEAAVREFLVQILDQTDDISWEIDPLGNLLVQKHGKQRAPHNLMISAHMDEVGCIITYIHSDGTLCLAPIGGIDASVVLGRQVLVGRKQIPGVIGAKPVHLLSKEEKETIPKFSSLVLDIGASSADEASKIAPVGTYVSFLPNFCLMGTDCVCSKAIDDRAGCALLLNLLQQNAPYDFTAAFLVQEEIGLRGAKTAAYTIAPDFALVLEATTAADLPQSEDDAKVCCLGNGPVISFMDHGTIYDRELYQKAFAVCEKHRIPCQTKTRIAGGNDSSAIHISRGGVRTLAVSLPCRYLHSPSCLANLQDLDACNEMLPLLMQSIMEEV